MKKSVVVGVASALLLATAACGGTSTNQNNSQAGKQVVMAVQSLPNNLTTAPWGGTPSQLVLSGLGSELATYTSKPDASGCDGPPGEVSGLLAESITVDSTRTAITVKLRALKSQVGNTLSADDVKWSFVDYGFVAQPVLKKTFGVAGYDTDNLVTVASPDTVKLNIKAWNSYTDQMLQNPLAYVYDSIEAKKHTTADDPIANKWLATHLADYSGWKLESFTPGQALTVTADETYGGPKRSISRLVVQAVPTDATRQQLITSGQATVATGFQYDQYKSLAGNSKVKVRNCPSLTMDNLMLSTKSAPLNDLRVRQAISMAINRQEIATGAYFGFAQPAVSSFNAAFGVGPASATYTFNVEKAKSLLAEAGVGGGFELTLMYSPTRPGPVSERTAVLLQAMLKNVGITVKLRQVASPTDFSTAVLSGAYQAVLYGEPVVIADPAYLGWIKFGNSPNNTTGFASAEYDRLRTELSTTPLDQVAKRTELIKQMAQIGDTQVPIIYLVETPNLVVTSTTMTTRPPLPNGPIRWSGIGS